MRITRLLPLLFVAAVSVPALAVTLTIGNDVSPNASDSAMFPTRTDIDLVHPASHSGNVTAVKVYWSSTGCANALKIKFFRRTGDNLALVAERGPFTPTSNNYTASLSPAVAVKQGDLIGVAKLTACGNAGAVSGVPSEGYLVYSGDVTGSVAISAGTAVGTMLALSGSGTVSEWMARVIPVVGSVAGAFGSQFKTEMQFFNPQTTGSMTCKVVFHPAGVGGSTSDTTRLVTLDPLEVFSTADVVAAMGQTGIGTLDVVVPAGQSVPMLLTRVYNDAGASGTSSLTQEAVEVSDAVEIGTNILSRGITGFLVTARNPSQTRFNVGVRTLFSGATLQVTLRDANGVVIRSVTKKYTATYFEQVDAATFTGGPIAGDQTIQVTVTSGSAIIYGSTTDNVTNDPAMQVVYGIFGIV